MSLKQFLQASVLVLIAIVAAREANTFSVQEDDERLVAIYITADPVQSDVVFEGRAGSVDTIQNSGPNLRFAGWISPGIDEIQIVVDPASTPSVRRIQLLSRPDVVAGMGDEMYRFSGFDVELPGMSMERVRCVIYGGTGGHQIVANVREPCT